MFLLNLNIKSALKVVFIIVQLMWYNFSRAQDTNNDELVKRAQLFNELSTFQQNKNLSGINKVYLDLAASYQASDISDSAIFYYREVIDYPENPPYENQLEDKAMAHNYLGNLYRAKGEYTTAVDQFEKGIAIAVDNEFYKREGSLLNSMGGLYVEIGDYQKGVEYVELALDIFTTHFPERENDICLLLANIGNIYIEIGDYRKSISYLQKADEINLKINNDYYTALISSGLGLSYLKQQDYNKALTYLELALSNAKSSGDLQSELAVMANIGQLYLETDKFEMAEEMLDEAYQKSKEVDDKYLQKESLLLLISLYQETADFEKAFYYQKEYSSLKDSLVSKDLLIDIANAELKYENAQKEKTILELKVKNQKQQFDLNRNRYLIIIGFTLLALVIATFILIILRNRLKNTAKIHEFENKMFRLQIRPHFIFNVLGSIQGYMNLNQGKKASAYLSKFARLIRNILEQSRKDFISLDKEIQNLKYYLDLQQMRFEDRFEFEFALDEEVDDQITLIPPMLIQPIIENAVEHGFSNLDYKGKLIISFKEVGDDLIVEVLDNGKGYVDSKTKYDADSPKKSSISTQLIKEQLQFFSEKYKREFSIKFESYGAEPNNTGTKVSIKMPYLSQNA
ncbi:tetratricopeptide repeat protein [Paracrocinitomix mangrovi]|uniref:tetratricopeptide repeat-containing sensor histidine kinase n=1 Tax=Paracrocinitomix mangrovi TaxID=2862509 RepID=UPI001C8DEFFB|nr:tetratricopeptide repeat protein [Paracrocinitomix mangrovi]UKN03608.1 tetratricopeptide repeat protein [Paracrocinitomix mangrovi]